MTHSEVSDECDRLGLPSPDHEELLSIKNDDNKIEIDAEIYNILVSN